MTDTIEPIVDAPIDGELPRPKTTQVVALLAGVALIFSYLIGFCLVNALVAAEVMKRWPKGSDPRWKIMAASFIGLSSMFGCIGALARWASRRQLHSIDEMERD